MGDDGVGVRVAEALASRDLGADVAVVSGGTDGMALTRHFMEYDSVVVVDAIAADDTPGSVYRFDPDDVGITSLRSHTSHGLSVPAIMFASRLQGGCADVIIFAVQIGDITCGFETLTPEVEAVVPEVAEMVAAEARRLAEQK
ncbi:MAG: hydrogenase maturation protease [Coriobacteriia bacterium]|nr:hydrogenase maturation protease [Coriobacteriia bacterium]